MATIRSISPVSGRELATFEEDSAAVVEHKLAAAVVAVGLLESAGWDQRRAWMHAASDLLEGEIDAVARMITAEMGKPIAQSRAEVTKSAYTMRFFADNAQKFLEGRVLADPSTVSASAARTASIRSV
ncbi:aldehyde dehydrogenase family protein [Microbacterium sp. 2MCAF23]|uniref:aldehyde dehydrogenase family protein n=1 Tax=Microbacterium sp. 2MCAF23 TaxID=3232985 RepID=UPI003F95B4D2